jgi:hypothetical protein
MIVLNKWEEKTLHAPAFFGMILVVASETVKILLKIFNRVK